MGKRIALLLAALIVSCGGGGGSSSVDGGNGSNDSSSSGSGGSGNNTVTITGKAVDGYLQGVKVCLDKNNSGTCDPGEPTAYTDSNGNFSLTVNAGDENRYPVIVEVRRDADGNEIGADYTLASPPGKYKVVSPLTTMVFSEMKRNPGLTPEEAEQALRERLGYQNVSLFEDYVSRSTQDQTYQKLRRIARVVGKLVADLASYIENTLGVTLSNDQKDELLAFVYGIAVENIDKIKIGVEAGLKDTEVVNEVKNGLDQNGDGNPDIDRDSVITSIGAIENLGTVAGTLRPADLVNRDFYWIGLTDEVPSQPAVRAYVASDKKMYKAKIRAINSTDEVKQNAYESNPPNWTINNDGTITGQDGFRTWTMTDVVEVDISGKTFDTCALLISEWERRNVRKWFPDLCTQVTFQQGDRAYISTIVYKGIDPNDNNKLVEAGKTISENDSSRCFYVSTPYTDWADFINRHSYGPNNYFFTVTGNYPAQFKPSQNNIMQGDIVHKDTGSVLGEYWTVRDPATNEEFVVAKVANTLMVHRFINGCVYVKRFPTGTYPPYSSLMLNKSAMDKVISAVKRTLQPLPDSATYPNIGYDYFIQNAPNTWTNATGARLVGTVNDTCDVTFDSTNKQLSLSSCSNNQTFNIKKRYNDYRTWLSSTNGVDHQLTYFDSDTICLYTYNQTGRFCITKQSAPDFNTVKNFFTPGKKFAYYKWNESTWALKYCLTLTGSSNSLTFTGYRYKTGGTIGGTVSLGTATAEFSKNSDSLLRNLVKVDTTNGIAIGYDPDDPNIALLVETNRCPTD